MIVLGNKMEDPYSVSNVTKALNNLYPTKAGRVDVTPTDVYVRFLPKSEEEYQKLVAAGYEIMDHPLDYKIVRDGDYYHDPEVSDEEITWQYAVVPHGTAMPSDIEYEVLDDCFIPETGADTNRKTELIGRLWSVKPSDLPEIPTCMRLPLRKVRRQSRQAESLSLTRMPMEVSLLAWQA